MDNRTRVKICGLTNLEDARFASGAMADYLGFIFYPKSPRYIEPGEAGAIINWIEGPEKVGVFVNQPLDEVNQIAKETGLDYVQLHGNESLEYCQLIDKPIIKVIHITDETSADSLKAQIALYSEVASYYLFDSKVGDQWGGTGTTFDWSILEGVGEVHPFFLSGGINPDNVQQAIKTVKPFGIDISSGVEEKPGLKDFEKIEQLMEAVQAV